jgi:uncharacterized protein (TIGR03067 family)
MKRALLTVVALALLGSADPGKDDANKKDLQQMQGDWAAASGVRDGAKVADDEIQVIFSTIKGNEATLYLFDKAWMEQTFTIDATKKPKTIEMTSIMGPEKGKPMLGVYEIDKNTFKVCLAEPGKDRPMDFAAKAGSGHMLTVWEREKK